MKSTVNPEKILLGFSSRMASLQAGGKRLKELLGRVAAKPQL